jgi:hypothetical protein
LPEGITYDREERKEKLANKRKDAVEDILKIKDREFILEFAAEVQSPYELGQVLGEENLFREDENSFITENLCTTDENLDQLARGFVYGRQKLQGPEWIESKIDTLSALTSKQQASLFRFLPFRSDTWRKVSEQGNEVERNYWSELNPYNVDNKEDAEYVIAKLLRYNRPFVALKFTSGCVSDSIKVSDESIFKVLESASSTKPSKSDMQIRFSYHLPILFDYLYGSNSVTNEQIAVLEWAFLPVLRPAKKNPKALHKELEESPELFVDFLTMIYTSEDQEIDDDEKEISDHEREKAEQALQLLRSWRTVPGQTEEHAIDKKKLFDWVKEARSILSDKGLLEIGDITIGKVLSGSPAGEDGNWPHEAIRDLFEELASEEIEEGLRTGKFNSRGGVTKAVYEGGQKEIELANEFKSYAQDMRNKWPRTSKILEELADLYANQAEREDVRSELREDLGK